MRLSHTFLPVLRDDPKEAEIVSHRLMLRAGLVRQASSGIYVWLPLGLRVLRKIEAIIREEQTRAGAAEVLMPMIQSADLWRESGRYDAYGPEMLRLKDRHERDMLFGPTNEEQITAIAREGLRSWRDLPKNLFQIQWKFRDEIRPRFGVMRGREFLMKDGYSFDIDEAAARHTYHRMFLSYIRTFSRMGLTAVPLRADTGPIGGDLSHEFVVLAETGESEVFLDRQLVELTPPGADLDYRQDLSEIVAAWSAPYAATAEMHDAAAFDALPAERRMSARGIEVGHIFYFGKKYTEPMGVRVQGADGKLTVPECGSYGIGVSRLAAAIIEVSHDAAGIVWPEAVAPYRFGIVNLKPGEPICDALATRLYAELRDVFGDEVLLDDAEGGAGAKFKSMELIGLPWQIVVGPKSAASGQVEVRRRGTAEAQTVDMDGVIDIVTHGAGKDMRIVA